MPKNKPCKGLLKRIRFTKSGKVKFRRAFGRHLRSPKSGKLKRSYRRPAFAKSCDVKRVRAMLFTSVRAGEAKTSGPSEAPATST
jgi:large subunit ribosomal protein L35